LSVRTLGSPSCLGLWGIGGIQGLFVWRGHGLVRPVGADMVRGACPAIILKGNGVVLTFSPRLPGECSQPLRPSVPAAVAPYPAVLERPTRRGRSPDGQVTKPGC